jgi:hypothetical protein
MFREVPPSQIWYVNFYNSPNPFSSVLVKIKKHLSSFVSFEVTKTKNPKFYELRVLHLTKMAVMVRYEIGMVKYRSGRWRSSRVFQIYGGILESKDILLDLNHFFLHKHKS